MISALILPLFLAGTQADIGGPPSGEPSIRLWINNDGRFLPGDHARVEVRTKDDGYLLVLQADPDGQLRVLFPLEPGDDNFVRGGERYEVRGRGGPEAFDIDGSWGRGMVYAAVSRDRFRFDGYRLGDHWDYGALAPSQLSREPESELTDLVSRMAPGDFDYDVVTYEVIERVVYASDYSPFLFAFDPFFFDPFFAPFRFDPFFRRPFFQQPVSVDPVFHRPFFFSPRGLAPVPFRDRRQQAVQAPRDNWPVDVSPRRQSPVAEPRLANWPVDVSPRSRRLVTEAGLANWPVDVSPLRRDPSGPPGAPGLRPSHQPQGQGPRPASHRPIGLRR